MNDVTTNNYSVVEEMIQPDKDHYVNSHSQLDQEKLRRKHDRLARAIAHAGWLKAYRHVCDCCHLAAHSVVSDHNHQTGLRRGFICRSCNITLGYVEWAHDHPEQVTQLLRYLRAFDPKRAKELSEF